MVNRSSIKYALKKILPERVFTLIHNVWQKKLIRIITKIDILRLKKFTDYQVVRLHYKGHAFDLWITPQNGFIDNHIFLYGVYEPFMLDLFSQHLKPGQTFIDIGANIGQHSMYAACLVGQTGNVHAFEPIPSIYNQIKDSARHNAFEKIVHVYNYALGEKEKVEKFFISKNVGGSSLVNDDDTQEIISVHVKNGDKELAAIQNVDVVKIDVEGYEYEVLQGIKQTLNTHRPKIFIEFSGNFYHTQGKGHGAKILKLLRDLEYELFDIEDNLTKITDDILFDETISKVRKQTNLLCIKKKD